MTILTIRTDKPVSEIGLYDDTEQIAYIVWEAHRQLAETLHKKIKDVLTDNQRKMSDIEGIVVFKGPGSFTGLRIGVAVANSIAYAEGIPIVADSDEWIERGIKRLINGESDSIINPDYGQTAHITLPKK